MSGPMYRVEVLRWVSKFENLASIVGKDLGFIKGLPMSLDEYQVAQLYMIQVRMVGRTVLEPCFMVE